MSSTTSEKARKSVLPVFTVTETCSEQDEGAELVTSAKEPYFVRSVRVAVDAERRDGKPKWSHHRFNLFPLVLDSSGAPWPEANLFILSNLENTPNPDMRTFDAHALDLADFYRFIESESIDWTLFPASKLARPTYRYRGHLAYALRAGEVSAKTINRRMGTVVAFYRWLERESLLNPDFPAWIQRDVYISIKDKHGLNTLRKVVSTDLSIRVPKQDDPYEEAIQDGGKLRPLSMQEQEYLLDALSAAGNPEMTLIHLMGLLTGARLQTVCTIKLSHILKPCGSAENEMIRLPVGYGTGIDTKGDKQMVLQLPTWFYQALQVYSQSERAKRRRAKSRNKGESQYLFLTQHGTPFYSSKEDRLTFDPENQRRYDFDGGAIGTFIRSTIRPYVEKKFGLKKFQFKFHDTRATFGMNLTDAQLSRVEAGLTTLAAAREYVKTRMGHESAATTDLYLNFRHNLKFVREVVESHEAHLKNLCSRAMGGFE